MYDEKWEQTFLMLQDFVKEHGRFPTARESYRGVSIGRWYIYQKQQALSPAYPTQKVDKLEKLKGFEPVKPAPARTDSPVYYEVKPTNPKPRANWQENYQILRQFISEYGRLPKARESYQGIRIGNWCAAQKQAVKKPDFPADRRAKLEAVGLFEEHPDPRWARTFRLLKQYISEHGCFPMAEEEYHGIRLGRWCYVQKQKATKFTDYPSKQRELLKDIGLLE